MWLDNLILALLTLSAAGQFGDYKPPAPQCKSFTCPAGQKTMRKKGYKAWSYGCPDSGGANIMSMADLNQNDPLGGMNKKKTSFDKCCLEQDACMQTCGMTSKACHDSYEKCASKTCKGDKNCGFQGQMAQMMSSPYTPDYSNKEEDPQCTSYDRLQKESCECVDKDEWSGTLDKRLKTFYKLYNKEKIDSDGEIKDLAQVRSKWEGKEPDMFLELTKKYKDKAIERRVKPKHEKMPGEEYSSKKSKPTYEDIPDEYDATKGRGYNTKADKKEEAEVKEAKSTRGSAAAAEELSEFQIKLQDLEKSKDTAVEEENYDLAGNIKDEIKDAKRVEIARLNVEKKQAIEDEDYLQAKSIKKAIAALDPKQEL